MKKRAFILAAPVLIASLLVSACGRKPLTDAEVLRQAVSVIKLDQDKLGVQSAILDFAKSNTVRPFFDDAYGFAVFPTIGKGGMGVGGAHGKGWVFRGNTVTGETFMNQVTLGFQLGGQTFSQIIFFQDESAYSNFTSGNFEFGAQASAVAITIGANAQASTAGGTSVGAGNAQAKTKYTRGMAVFTLAKGGLMYEATVGGQKFSWRPFPEQ